MSSENKHLLTLNLIHQLLKLQQLFYHKYLTYELLNEMVRLYVAVLECFDKIYLPMRIYFLGKIQFLLSTPQVMQMVGHDLQPSHNINTDIMINGIKDYHWINEEGKSNQRSNKIQLQMKFMKEVENTVKNMSKEIDNVDRIDKEHHHLIDNMIRNQQDLLNQRLANRNKKTRKQSATIRNQQHTQPIKKEQLVQVHKQLTIAIERYTVRLTDKAQHKIHNNQTQKGRVMQRRRKQDNEEDEDQKNNEDNIFIQKIEQKHIQHQMQQPIATRTSAGHNPKDKGRVTVRKRNQQEDILDDFNQ